MLHRLSALAARPHLRPRTVRLRLTALYGALFLICGAGLLAITYALMWNVSANACYSQSDAVSVCASRSSGHGVPSTAPPRAPGGPDTPSPAQLESLAAGQHAHEMHQLLIRSGIALAIMAAVSIALGWLVAGRVLRPLRKITEVTRAISATNLHERLGFAGPDDELKGLADTIDALLARLDAAFDAQRRFVANASHELRTPLTLIRALLQMTLTDPDATLATFRATCQDILVEGERQERLIDALLVLARSERGLDHREPFDLAAIVDPALLARRPAADRLRIEVRTAVAEARTDGDPRLAERLITNLIDNALRHNVPGGHVDIATGTTAEHAFVSVANSGPAVPAGEVDRLFQPFQRLGADSTDHSDGLGLGLSIVQAVAEAHHAGIQARPRPGGGLHVRVAFPRTVTVDRPAEARTVPAPLPS
ncbi:MAG TPA: HAMP domain-containing sensor histidine kinase [Mycobacteriales bacterium]|nr:HAMP domain-containing sensor histidine kinase [Mycobacteriales bacterium]